MGDVIGTASLIAAALLLAGWNYWLTNRVQQLLNRADRQQDVIDRKLALVPSKSAPRTDGGHETARVWWQRLVPEMVPDLPRTEPMAAVVDVGIEQILDQPAKRRHAAPRKGK